MQKINFQNLPSTSTPLNASTLNQMQDNIESAIEDVESVIPTIENSLDSDSTTNGASVHATKLLNTYSTNELKIGTWIDGKPLYRKVINGYVQETSSGYPRIQTNLTNVDTICSIISTLKYSSRYYIETIAKDNFYIDSQENYDIVFILPPTSGDVCFIIEYTKSTD